jgi:hypothetical protein
MIKAGPHLLPIMVLTGWREKYWWRASGGVCKEATRIRKQAAKV